MKLEENNVSEVEILGDIEQNNVSIDTENIDFLMTLLTTNLYSNPIGSLLRELVSNAIDSHTEAGTDDPILISLLKDKDAKYSCEIQDFGTGLSEERFYNIYLKVGSSTKRESNDYIGAMGIGKYSPLSYTNTVYLTSVFDGIKYKYLMYQDNGKLKIDLIFKVETEDKNGFTVNIPFKRTDDYYDFIKEIQSQLLYFTNIYIVDEINLDGRYYKNLETGEYNTFAEYFNSLKIKKYKHFNINSIHPHKDPKLLLGNVSYPLDLKHFKSTTYIHYLNIHIPFEIGDLSFTPNREEIQYNEKTKKKIQEKIDLVEEELEEIVKNQARVDHVDIEKYYNEILYPRQIDLGLNFSFHSSSKREVSLKGIKYNEKYFIELFKYLHLSKVTVLAKHLDIDRIYGESHKNLQNTFLVCDYNSLTSIEKKYVRENWEGWFLLKNKITFRKFHKILSPSSSIYINGKYEKLSRTKEYYRIVRHYWEQFNKNVTTICKKDIPQDYIKEEKRKALENRKKSDKGGINWSEEINLFLVRRAHKGGGTALDSYRTPLKDLYNTKKNNKINVYTEKGEDVDKYYYVFRNFVNFVQIAPTKIKLLKDIPNFITLDDFMNVKNKYLRKVATAYYIKKTYPHLIELNTYGFSSFLKYINPNLKQLVTDIDSYVNEYLKNTYEEKLLDACLETCKVHKYMDNTILSLIEKPNPKLVDLKKEQLKKNPDLEKIKILKQEIEKNPMVPIRLAGNSKVLLLFRSKDRYSNNQIPVEMWNVVADYVKARKLFPISIECVSKLKEETIYNIKKEEDESN